MFSSRWSKKLRTEDKRFQFESLEDRRVMSATGVTGSPLALEPAPAVQTAPTLLTTEEWVHSLTYSSFHLLTPQQIVYLLPSQVATIPNWVYFSGISAESRAVLNQAQVQALNVANCRIHLLTSQQIGYLTTAQIQQVGNADFGLLMPTQIPSLTAAQIQTITTGGVLMAMGSANRAALTPSQVQTLRVDLVRINNLTTTQISWLTLAQIQSLQSADFPLLAPSQIPSLSTQQIAGMTGLGAFDFWSDQSRAAMTPQQIQAINTSSVRIHRLSAAQVALMTNAQIQSVMLDDLSFVPASRIPNLSTAQIAAIPNWQYVNLWSSQQRAALTASQIRALRPEALRLSMLTTAQVGFLRVAQVQRVGADELHLLQPAQMPYLTRSQIVNMPVGVWTAMPEATRAALTQQQVTWLNVALYGIQKLTPTQIGWLTVGQIRSLPTWELSRLQPSQISLLKATQIAAIRTGVDLPTWSAAQVAALTYDQVRLLTPNDLHITRLTSEQIGWLRKSQIQAVPFYEFELLHAAQIPFLTNEQFAAITTVDMLRALPDELEEMFSQEQLLSVPWDILEQYIISPASVNYHPAVHMPIGPDGVPIAAHLTAEAERFFALAPLAAVTHRTVGSGDWSNPAIWQNGVVPTAGAKVQISSGTTVRFDSVMSTFAINTLRIDGTLQFAVDRNTELRADTIVVMTAGKLHIGTAAAPIQNQYTAKISIAANGPINTVTDPFKLGRGLVSRGEVRMHGEYVTPYTTLATNVTAGATQLQLSSVPTNWNVGDRLVITGNMTNKTDDFGADEVQILAISGNVVTVTPLRYPHASVPQDGLFIHVTNISRNIIFASTGTPPVQERPHMVFFHNPNVQIENIGVYGFGRTDKSIPINDPVVTNGVLQAGTGTNPRARYALHFHHTGVNPILAPAIVRGSVVDGSPGWGFVNHSSNVQMEYNVAYKVKGSSFVGEDGNEIGVMRGNLSVNATGSFDGLFTRQTNHDWGFGGHGFWFQGPGIKVIDNISAGSQASGFAYMTTTEKTLFDAVNLADPSQAYGHEAIPVAMAPIAEFRGNFAYTGGDGLEIWHHLLETHENESVIDNFTTWGIRGSGISLHYTGPVKVRNARLLNDINNPIGAGVFTNDFVHDLTLQNLTVIGFQIGVDATLRGDTLIENAYFATPMAVYVGKGRGDTRRLELRGNVTFAALTAAQLGGEPQWKLYASGDYDTTNFVGYEKEKVLAPDYVLMNIAGTTPYRVSFYQQAENYVPFPSATSSGFMPNEYLNKTNAQLQSQYGVSFAGEALSMSSVTTLPQIYGLVRYGL